jgi:hypothetical protein
MHCAEPGLCELLPVEIQPSGGLETWRFNIRLKDR